MWTVIVRDPQGKVHARVPLNSGSLTIGRGKDRTVVLPSTAVSRAHGRLEVRGRQLVYVDEGSGNGSIVNGQPALGAVSVDERTVIDIAGYRVSVEKAAADDEPKFIIPEPVRESFGETTPRSAAPPAGQESATELLERQLRGIQTQRTQVQQTVEQRRKQVDAEWAQVVDEMRKLQAKIGKNPKVQHFTIARDGSEVAVKLSDPSEKRGYGYFVLSRLHPDGQYPELTHVVWLREFGGDDRQFTEPKRAMTELVQRIAGKLA